jgi:hypothetical protein
MILLLLGRASNAVGFVAESILFEELLNNGETYGSNNKKIRCFG